MACEIYMKQLLAFEMSISLFRNPLLDLNIWYDDRYWSKILFRTISTPSCDGGWDGSA